MKNTQSKMEPIKIGKQSGTTYKIKNNKQKVN